MKSENYIGAAMKRVTQQEIAKRLNLSRQTIVRVLDNDPSVAKDTRKRVIAALNKYGYHHYNLTQHGKVVVDTKEKGFCRELLQQELLDNITKHGFEVVVVNAQNDRAHFITEVQHADALIFATHTSPEIVRLAKEINPDIYIIYTYANGERGTDVSIEPDNHRAAKMAAEYLFNMGHRDIFLLTNRSNLASFTRAKIFLAEFIFEYSGCTVEPYFHNYPDPDWQKKVAAQILARKKLPSVIYATGGFLFSELSELLKIIGLRCPEDISVLTHDDPQDVSKETPEQIFDSIICSKKALYQLAEYFLLHRLALKNTCQISCMPEIAVKVSGTVLNINGGIIENLKQGMNI